MSPTTPLTETELLDEGASEYSKLIESLKSLDQVYVGNDAKTVVQNGDHALGIHTSDSQNRKLVNPAGDEFPLEVDGNSLADIKSQLDSLEDSFSDSGGEAVSPYVEPPSGATDDAVRGSTALVYDSKADAEADDLPNGTLVLILGDGLYVEDGS